jgi:uncharacterized membrane protein YkoI
MRNRHDLLFGLALAGLTFAGPGCAHSNKEEAEENEVKMTLDEAPPAVREGLLREANGATITSVEKEDEHGHVVYEADVQSGRKVREIQVDPDGKPVSHKHD